MYTFFFGAVMVTALSVLSFSCSPAKKLVQPAASIKGLKYLNSYEIPFNLKFDNTVVGGLSGIDYDVKKDLYYLVSDDRSERNPARFYTARLFISANGIDSVTFLAVHNLLQPDGKIYSGRRDNREKTPDPEGIRFNPQKNYLAWSSEGERVLRAKDTLLTDPAVFIMDPDGKYINSFSIPANLQMVAIEKGPRRNGAFEGISFADNYRSLFVNTEEPLYEDGPRADITDNNAYIRFIKFDIHTKKSIAQFAYKLEPVAFAAKPEKEFKLNGVSEILHLGNNTLLVMERSFSTGRMPCTIKLFTADLQAASDISTEVLQGNTSFTPAPKTLLLNMDDLGIYTDNLEGVTFGPLLPNGHKTLVFVADNNFNMLQKTQLLLFEVLED